MERMIVVITDLNYGDRKAREGLAFVRDGNVPRFPWSLVSLKVFLAKRFISMVEHNGEARDNNPPV